MTQLQALDDVDLLRDRSLVELAQAGDVAAFGELYDRYFRRLERFCVKRLGDPTEAEEVAQEAFTRAWRALPTFGGERRFYPWITVIASRICVDTVRRQARFEFGEVRDAPITETGFSRVETEGDLDTLQQALGRITHRHREALELREHRGWSYQHIAEYYDVSVGTVEALLWRARQSLRREFLALCSCVAGFPLVRRWAASSGTSPSGALATLGSVGTVVALAIGAAAPAAAGSTVPVTAVAAVASYRDVAAHTAGLAVAPPTVAPPAAAAASDPAASGTERRSAADRTTGVRGSTAPPSSSSDLSPLVPQPQVLPPAAASAAARRKPVVVDLSPLGPVVGVDPGIPLTPIDLSSGGAK